MRRKVFYVSGFDPRGVRQHYQTYRKHANLYAEITGENIQVSKRSRSSSEAVAWHVTNESQQAHADYTYLDWDSIIKDAWIRHPFRLFLYGLKTYAYYALHADWRAAWQLPKSPLLTFVSPLLILALLPLVVFLLTLAVLPSQAFSYVISTGVALLATLYGLKHYHSLWLLRFFIFNGRCCMQFPEVLDERLENFAAIIKQALDDSTYDEVLLVCHSNGSLLAPPLMEKLIEQCKGVVPAHFALVTLGHCIPLLSYLKSNHRFRAHLGIIAQTPLVWLDIGSPADGVCYALTDPLRAFFSDYKTAMHVVNPQFYKYYPKARYEVLKKDKFAMHFLYTECADNIAPTNYYAITTGAMPLKQRISQLQMV